MRATRVLIHLDAFRGNIQAARKRVGPGVQLCVPVKADAYGHGAVPLARTALEEGASFLAVAAVSEGAELRAAGIQAPVLLLSIPVPEELPDMLAADLIPLVFDKGFVKEAASAAEQAGKRLTVHLKVDTGMGRVGCRPEEAAELARFIAGYKNLALGGTATHLAVSDSAAEEDVRYTKEQLRRFREAADSIRNAGIDPGIVHAANTGAVCFHNDAFFDMVRPGILLYGYAPSGASDPVVKPVMEFVSRVVFIKRARRGETVSYGRIWTADRDTLVATIPAGYGDGLPRRLSGTDGGTSGYNFQVRIRDRWYPLVGRICMDQFMVDLGPGADIQRWEEVTVFGGDARSAADIAAQLGTISYEITCGINKRVPRVYVG
jgi:alanine racemase